MPARYSRRPALPAFVVRFRFWQRIRIHAEKQKTAIIRPSGRNAKRIDAKIPQISCRGADSAPGHRYRGAFRGIRPGEATNRGGLSPPISGAIPSRHRRHGSPILPPSLPHQCETTPWNALRPHDSLRRPGYKPRYGEGLVSRRCCFDAMPASPDRQPCLWPADSKRGARVALDVLQRAVNAGCLDPGSAQPPARRRVPRNLDAGAYA